MKKYRNTKSPCPECPAKGFTPEEIEEAIQEAAKKDLIVDSGDRRWSERTGRYEIVWKSKIYERPN